MEKELSHAAILGDLEKVKQFEGLCTDIDVETALRWAAEEGHLEVVRYLTELERTDVNATDKDGNSALMKATGRGHAQVVRYLVEQGGADVSIRNKFGHTVLMTAAVRGLVEVVEYVAKQRGSEVDATDNNGDTALMAAARLGDIEVARFLAELGADVDTRNGQGETAVRLAANRGHQDMQRLLTQYLTLSIGQPSTSDLAYAAVWYGRPPSSFIPPSEVELNEFVETGNIGGEYRAKWLDADVVVKLFIPDASHSTFDEEVRMWLQLRHPNVIKMYGACDVGPQLKFFVCEYASEGSLIEYVKASSVEKSPTIWKFLHEAALGLEYLHERGIAHGDLRCNNILIGSDDLAKLSNFGLTDSMKSSRLEPARAGSLRWQSPEVLVGGQQLLASDVYSLGMCILEAATRNSPWEAKSDYIAAHNKTRWTPEADAQSWFDPECPPGDVHDLVWRMCCQDPAKRASLSSIVYELERLAVNESSDNSQPEYEPVGTFDGYEEELKDLWTRVQRRMEECEDNQYHRVFDELTKVRDHLQHSTCHSTLLPRFHTLLMEFNRMIKMSTEQARIMRLSSTRATTNSFYGFHWRIQYLLAVLGDSVDAAKEREVQWQQQHSEYIELFVSGASNSYLLVHELKSPEERSAFLKSLKIELKNGHCKYTSDQLEVMKKAYEDIASKLESDDLSELTPEWFIPWYELIVDEWNCLGSGGFGSVYRAKWLDSDVVVKRVSLVGDNGGSNTSSLNYSYMSLSASMGPSTSQAQGNATQRAEALAMFRSEVDIWFGCSHPHVVRLFGACHVGKPFFVCEHAPNGTLVSFLRKHPDQLWSKLHEAALGVQYLHARNVVHGDLKGNNIMIGRDLKAKVTDFGLSSVASNEAKPQVSAALHWVAPECFPVTNEESQDTTGQTFGSDVYSFGMCIVEALRVVENAEAVKLGEDAQPCLPWGRLDNFMVRYHASKRKLPSKPVGCEDNQWKLVKRMCAFEPHKISTVVGELARLARGQGDDATDTSPMELVELESAPEEVAKARVLLAQLRDDENWRDSDLLLYTSLWNQLEQVHGEIDSNSGADCCTIFSSLVAEAHVATSKLVNTKLNLISLAESSMRCYALRRRLDKFREAYLLVREASLS